MAEASLPCWCNAAASLKYVVAFARLPAFNAVVVTGVRRFTAGAGGAAAATGGGSGLGGGGGSTVGGGGTGSGGFGGGAAATVSRGLGRAANSCSSCAVTSRTSSRG